MFLNKTRNPIEPSDGPKINKSNGTNIHKIAHHLYPILRSLENINEKLGKISNIINYNVTPKKPENFLFQ